MFADGEGGATCTWQATTRLVPQLTAKSLHGHLAFENCPDMLACQLLGNLNGKMPGDGIVPVVAIGGIRLAENGFQFFPVHPKLFEIVSGPNLLKAWEMAVASCLQVRNQSYFANKRAKLPKDGRQELPPACNDLQRMAEFVCNDHAVGYGAAICV
jgi:hypothetical protein